MRKKIQVLPNTLINKIAAGEVVERPASVVKELLENALDASASRIAITIEEGGRTLIRVSDDGSGIPPEEAALAFTQHATSKIADVEDLFSISTLGFRGEALASIASVSHAALITRKRPESESAEAAGMNGESDGVRIEVKDSMVGPLIPCAAPMGTTVEVRDLFYSVPARRKFLRTDGTEFSHIHEMVLRSAIPHPEITFTLQHNGRQVLDLPATADARLRVAGALGGGTEETKGFYQGLVGIGFSERGITVKGFAGQPSLARPTARYQYLFLNGRFIRDRSLFHAMKEAYRGLIEPAAQPVAILFIEMDPAAFDINVHPQKTEVRFRDSGAVYRAVLAALREKLLESDLTPAMKVDGRSGQWPAVSGQNYGGDGAAIAAAQTRQVIAEFFKQATPVQPRLVYGVEAQQPSVIDDPSRITVSAEETRNAQGETGNGGEGIGYRVQGIGSAMGTGRPARKMHRQAARNPSTLNPIPSPAFVQLHNTYIVAQTAEGMIIIDQHALHERIIYEELFARATRGVLEGQRLLIPEILPVNPRQAAALETVKPLLLRLGIEADDFDAGSVAVYSFPSLLAKVSPRDFLRDLLDRLMEYGAAGGAKLSAEELLHEVLDMASCKAAVKAGYPLSADEIQTLLARKEQVERGSNCPHGRPTTLRLTLADLEKQFKRR